MSIPPVPNEKNEFDEDDDDGEGARVRFWNDDGSGRRAAWIDASRSQARSSVGGARLSRLKLRYCSISLNPSVGRLSSERGGREGSVNPEKFRLSKSIGNDPASFEVGKEVVSGMGMER